MIRWRNWLDAIGEVGCNKCTWLGCYFTGSNPVLITIIKIMKLKVIYDYDNNIRFESEVN